MDKLVKVFTKAGTEEWVLVHVEVQGYNDSEFAKRMFTYFYRILDHYNKPVTCIAIFTDGNKSYQPSGFSYNFLGTYANFGYNTYKIIDQNESELRASDNPFALVILTALIALKKGRVTDNELFSLKMDLIKALLQKEIPKDKIRAIMNFIRYYVFFDNAEMIAKFEHEINLITNKHTTMGIEQFLLQRAKNEGIQEERDNKNLSIVRKLLIQSNFTAEEIAQVVEVPVSFVEEVRDSLLKTSN